MNRKKILIIILVVLQTFIILGLVLFSVLFKSFLTAEEAISETNKYVLTIKTYKEARINDYNSDSFIRKNDFKIEIWFDAINAQTNISVNFWIWDNNHVCSLHANKE